jgi:single-stranded-DNA-specific exonuclease
MPWQKVGVLLQYLNKTRKLIETKNIVKFLLHNDYVEYCYAKLDKNTTLRNRYPVSKIELNGNNCIVCITNWIYPEKKELSPELIKIAGSNIIATLLANRGIDTAEKAKTFLDIDNIELSSPNVFEHMPKAVERITKAIEQQEHIIIYGDFDADGITSTSLLVKTFRHIGANVSYYIPDRSKEGHGLNSKAICKLISSRKAKLIVTVDCGVSDKTEIALAKGLGVDVIVTDHHEIPETLPPAYAIINPKMHEEYKDLQYLAGVGVAYKLAQALLEF